ncbi:COMM domain-containing protein 3-like [Dysidea avara]|uniref:COMM domain-containing protein 3-like n=1 Tax=Dysidea avara TaxID=196820 RepID=UPI003324CE27
MELSSSTVKGIEAASSSSLSDESYAALVTAVYQCALGLVDQFAVEAIKGDHVILKESFAGLLSLLMEAAKCDSDLDGISGVLEDHKMSHDRVQVFTEAYKEHKVNLRANLGRVCSTLPHMVDVNWRLDYHIKNNHLERVNKPVYLIDLKSAEDGGGAQFACTQEQLQDLVSKLRDATKNLERCSDNN